VTNLKKTVYKKHSFTIKAIQALIVSGGISTIITTSTKKILFPQALKNYGLALNPYLPMGPEKRAMHFWPNGISIFRFEAVSLARMMVFCGPCKKNNENKAF
jgi:hypothetical protein